MSSIISFNMIRCLYRSILQVSFFLIILSLSGLHIQNCLADTDSPLSEEEVDFTTFSLEKLIDYEITAVSKKPEKRFEAAAAIFVITQEDITRSGFTTLPEVFCMVPSMQVVRIDPGDFAVSSYGFEASVGFQPLQWWKLETTFTWLQINLDLSREHQSFNPSADEKLSPSTRYSFRPLMDITPQLEFDVSIYFMDDIKGFDVNRYTDLSLRLGWKPVKGLELSIGRNLLDNRHNEFTDEIYNRARNEVRRTVYGRIA